ncbi:MAG TPA: NAD-dependent epimerase/dehydratase family protein [Gemmatimonadaceae bacterium]|nr:NAD-dependent epimerase/dehydratase family protein [Gemmatimonadaceae bacterium]
MSQLGKAVVTGASGLIGHELVQQLVERGVRVVAIDRDAPSVDGARCVSADLAKPSDLARWSDEDTTIYHLAASADVRGSVVDPRYDFSNTLSPFFEVLEVARETGARVIFPSTASVFDPSAPLPLVESAAKLPSSPYAAAKLAGEAYCAAYNRAYAVDVRIARMFSVYGPRMSRLAIHDIVRKFEMNSSCIEIFGDGTQVRDYLHVSDAARGLEIIASRGKPGEDYNLASGIPVTVMQLTQAISKLMGCNDARIEPTGESFPGDTPRWYASLDKIRSIGFEPAIDFETGLAETVRAIQARPVFAHRG